MIFFRRSHVYDPDWETTLRIRWLMWTSGWRGVVVLITLILGAVLSWKAAEIYEDVKIWRAERLIAQFELARAKGDMLGATSALRQAAILLQRHPLVLRAVARYQLDMKQLAGLTTYGLLIASEHATLADRVNFAREAYRLGRPDLAAEVMDELRENPETRDSAVVLALRAMTLAGQEAWGDAIKQARAACASSKGDGAEQAFAQAVLAKLLLQPPPSVGVEAEGLIREGIDLVVELAQRLDGEGLEALEMLVTVSKNPTLAPYLVGRDVRPLFAAAEKHSQAPPRLKIGLWSMRLAAEPGGRAEIYEELFERFEKWESSGLRLEAARWLNQQGMHRLAKKLAEPVKSESEEGFLVYLDATAAQGEWAEVTRILGSRSVVPLSSALRHLYELRAEMATGGKVDVEAAWREIELTARHEKVGNLLYIAGYAEQIGFGVQAARFYQEVLEEDAKISLGIDKLNRMQRMGCQAGLLRTAGGGWTLAELGERLSAFAGEFPDLDEVQNDAAYIRLLIGKDWTQAVDTARRLLRKRPELLAYRTTAVLAALREQEQAEVIAGGLTLGTPQSARVFRPDAAALYDGWTIDWKTAHDRYKVVYVAAMRAAGRVFEAEQVAGLIQKEALRPEERQLAGLP